ncbi:tRNA uridine-5-carboxymethylaminomethyl(34) synthesis GTPase MnmE [Curvibacter sp. CHRR-16]|uniref:tRNA uridine-5-carboxymethylaminomethyl(34) synthesis GTPase MnmE n=1 Tax=Curvibacter sp. CHRR-16 TaxID=2835872 RepID=UPI001BDA8F89|nr:tRNA uridine-5-carboxymethylaminomethyl(34) synthesis GTPase MnmE [Curvibacter sp. CHRR-16]MBT0570326.1 tRNA uridine-5-carboxymethylaminomethyl(34) synthesis GTPase MnmE [Curvibacter sp. CHRR-16]
MTSLARHRDPIIAIATAPGRGAVGIVRISGPQLGPFIAALLGKALVPRQATYLPFNDGHGAPLDHGLALHFVAPQSYTGEDVLELQAHGGPVVLQLLVARCLELAQQLQPTGQPWLAGLRLAQAGEFTQRAFMNGKLDLAQAEAIADLIDASTEAAARGASQSLSGAFSREIAVLRERLIHLRMLVEATLDFPEEEIDFLQKADAVGQLQRLRQQLQQVQAQAQQGALLREGLKVVIAGQPNAGKSSLLNALAGAELAIVTPIAGTTRDKVQETIQIEGVPIHIVDTAGLRASDDEVERIGIQRAWGEIEQADVLLFLHDLSRASATEYVAAEADIASLVAEKLPQGVPVLHVWNKADAVPPQELPSIADGVVLSAKTGEGLQPLRMRLLELAGWQPAGSGVYLARQRHLQALHTVQEHLSLADEWLQQRALALDILAEELRLAQNALNQITGEFGSDDLLGVIFSQFCIGK